MSASSGRSSKPQKETAIPDRPALPVRADPVDVRLRLVRHVVIEDVGQLDDVQPPRGDVRRNQYADRALLEGCERRSRDPWACPVDRLGPDSRAAQGPFYAVARGASGEHQCVLHGIVGQQVLQQLCLSAFST
jgi:hypothetical protein